MKLSSKRPRFPGVRLGARDRQCLADQTREGRAVSARAWKRIRILELLHERWSLADVAEAVGTYPREVRRTPEYSQWQHAAGARGNNAESCRSGQVGTCGALTARLSARVLPAAPSGALP
jgi:hypothetical protein